MKSYAFCSAENLQKTDKYIKPTLTGPGRFFPGTVESQGGPSRALEYPHPPGGLCLND